ncbi:NAD(P)H-dependent oxidoreductase [Paenibacillus melissococcoides]|uniref:NAD(P)H-dependent oxidoreductase n=1 Tax=Paenibacillus melissococcoides TaxID=2912268 RepID=A0ABN8UB79_9BACL|nr:MULTISPECIES: NADPH-dependent FMN reductase [Paenibacillus]MEB9892731.1 NAD(P)H-dependent oxidoreductase [Bacillus cereus]CAH8247028.1 NAD(P)H-dependent oxidoreductase [Paenibacillus melissococcoides]CAH8716529.1 NAD(P)H-dependent oxidoreductase [Paenibacillus melissococcoides]CAH8717500.1 NAD(P)H-dependent oxidoreductase [Paenibacillus melissococcoides]GIO76558.1 FMN-dependent NADPH-azoreductase [Paenibacillus dendritiformis]
MRIVCIAGSNHADATSSRLVHYLAARLQEKGHEAEVVELHLLPLPLYNPDVDEENANVLRLKKAVKESDAIVLATPEYHGSLSGVLKNALDYLNWDDFNNKVVLSVSSAGGAVGVSSLSHLQTIVRNLHGINCPEWISIGGDQREFTADGVPSHEQVVRRVNKTLDYFLALAKNTSSL